MRQGEAAPASRLPSYGMALFALAAVTALFLAGRLPIFVAMSYWVLSLVLVIAYALDKSAARRNSQRLSENSLHLISMLGGWPGALIAQQLVRHKTQKQGFRTVFWITVLVNVALMIWLLTARSTALPARL